MNRFDNLKRPGIADRVELASAAITDARNVLGVIDDAQAHEAYNLSGQSSVGLSFCQPLETLNSNFIGTVNILEAIRQVGRECRFYNASSGECFGDTSRKGPTRMCSFVRAVRTAWERPRPDGWSRTTAPPTACLPAPAYCSTTSRRFGPVGS